jgi:FAD synthase
MGPLKDGHPVCRNIGFPTYTLEMEEDVKLVPPEGVYAISLIHGTLKYKGMLNVKQFEGRQSVNVEVHLFDHDHEAELRDEIVKVQFHKRMREELDLGDPEALHRQLERDKSEIEQLIY